MKKILSIIAGLAIMVSANAQMRPVPNLSVENLEKQKITATSVVSEANAVMDAISIDKPSNSILGGYGLDVSSYFGGQAGQTNSSSQTPMAYEPFSNTLWLFSNSISHTDPPNPPVYRHYGILAYSQDIGKTWSRMLAYDYEAGLNQYNIPPQIKLRSYSSVAVANAKKTSNIEDVSISYRSLIRQNQVGYPVNEIDNVFGFMTGEDVLNNVVGREIAEISGPWSESKALDFGYAMKATSAVHNDQAWVYYYGKTWAEENSQDTTSYFVSAINVTDATADPADIILENGSYSRNITEINKNFGGEMPGGSTYKSTNTVDVDPLGNVYMLTLNLDKEKFESDDDDVKYRRYPKIFKSDISGNSFVLHDSLPESSIVDYLNTEFALVDEGWAFTSPYNMEDNFIVTGVDEYSFLADFIYYIQKDGKTAGVRQLTEFAKKDDKWTIRKIDVLNTVFFVTEDGSAYVRAPFELYIDTVGNKHAVFVSANAGSSGSNQFEIQLAKTADNQYLVAKYINCYVNFDDPDDPKNQNYRLPEEMTFYWMFKESTGETTRRFARDTAFPYAQTFVSYRKIDGGEWSTPVKAIKSDTISTRYTTMPRIVPNINNIPVLFCVTKKRNTTDDFNIFHSSLPAVLANNVTNNYNYGMLMVADATKDNNIFTSIVEGQDSDIFTLNNASPNPANTEINFEFSLAAPAYTTLTVYNALGQVVSELANEFLAAKYHSVTYNTSNLPNGTYYYVLKSGARSETRMFNVSR